MRETDRIFSGSVPALYDRYLGPLIFEPYAVDLAERVAKIGAKNLLEVAAGTGIATRALAHSLPKRVAIVATDLNQPMLDFAAARSDPRITWRQADALKLPFEDGSFDLVVCQFGMMFLPDKPAAYREALRVLQPAGRFVFSVWDRIEENEVAHAVAEGVAALFPKDPPRFLARTPYGYHDSNQIRSELQSAGFRCIAVEAIQYRSRADSHRDPAIGFCQGTPLRNEIEARDSSRLTEATDAAAASVAARFGIGPINGKMQAHLITAAR
jgi:ubiquinone/menaquinone biosynthesis C-methylase UbiE